MGGAVHVVILAGADCPQEDEEPYHAHGDGDRDEYEQSHFFVPEAVER
jgi:hypothetical protein